MSLLQAHDSEQMNPALALLCLGFWGVFDGAFFVDFNFPFLFEFKQH